MAFRHLPILGRREKREERAIGCFVEVGNKFRRPLNGEKELASPSLAESTPTISSVAPVKESALSGSLGGGASSWPLEEEAPLGAVESIIGGRRKHGWRGAAGGSRIGGSAAGIFGNIWRT